MTKQTVRKNAAAGEVTMPTAVIDAPIQNSTPTVEGAQGAEKNGRPSAPSQAACCFFNSVARQFTASHLDEAVGNRQAELFYLQKQIQLQTQMIFVMEDGARIQGVVEWYDRHSIKVRGKSRVLIYKAAIKYLYKAGEVGSAPNE